MKYAATLSSVLCCLAIPVSAQIVHVWDLADTAQAGQFQSRCFGSFISNPDGKSRAAFRISHSLLTAH